MIEPNAKEGCTKETIPEHFIGLTSFAFDKTKHKLDDNQFGVPFSCGLNDTQSFISPSPKCRFWCPSNQAWGPFPLEAQHHKICLLKFQTLIVVYLVDLRDRTTIGRHHRLPTKAECSIAGLTWLAPISTKSVVGGSSSPVVITVHKGQA